MDPLQLSFYLSLITDIYTSVGNNTNAMVFCQQIKAIWLSITTTSLASEFREPCLFWSAWRVSESFCTSRAITMGIWD